jgi:hypothetical protein
VNGLAYFCEGCGRMGHADEFAPYYECPVCRWVAPLPQNARSSVQALLALEGRRFVSAVSKAEYERVKAVYPNA